MCLFLVTSLPLTGRIQAVVFLGKSTEHLTLDSVYNRRKQGQLVGMAVLSAPPACVCLKRQHWKETETLRLQDIVDLDG